MTYHEVLAGIVKRDPGRSAIYIVCIFLSDIGWKRTRVGIKFGFATIRAAEEAGLIRSEKSGRDRLLFPVDPGEGRSDGP